MREWNILPLRKDKSLIIAYFTAVPLLSVVDDCQIRAHDVGRSANLSLPGKSKSGCFAGTNHASNNKNALNKVNILIP